MQVFKLISLTPCAFIAASISLQVFSATPRVASSMTVTFRPSLLASMAVLPTQKSRASPTTTTSLILKLLMRAVSSVGLLLVPKALQDSSCMLVPFKMSTACLPLSSSRGDSSAPVEFCTQWTGQRTCFSPFSSIICSKGFLPWLTAKDEWLTGCQSLLQKMRAKLPYWASSLMQGKIALEPATSREPPQQKSFWASTIIRAFILINYLGE